MPKINVLPKSVYSLIAAGEVVERPLNVVKEMVENSIDAGAKNITVEIKNGGRTYIRITDDGCGIAKDDVRNVFKAHATSKIATEGDLEAISTLGFRGEAMASVAAVAKVELLTKTEFETVGTRYEIEGGVEKDFSEAGCPVGTTVAVRDLFFNVPVRMKFLKKDVTEGNAVQGVVEKIALSHPEIGFRFLRDGNQVLVTPGNGKLKDAIYCVYGKAFSATLIEVNYEYDGMRLTGFTSLPHESRKNRSMQIFYINGRYVKSVTAMSAMTAAYKNSVMTGMYPACVLNIEMDPKAVDANIHPSKVEVRFFDERAVFNLIFYGVKTALETGGTVKNFKTDEENYAEEHGAPSQQNFFRKPEEPEQLKMTTDDINNFWSVASPTPQVLKLDNDPHLKKKDGKNPYDFSIKVEDDDITTLSFLQNAAKNSDSGEPYNLKVEFGDDKEAVDSVEIKEQPKEQVKIVGEKAAEQSFRLIGEAFKTYIIIEMGDAIYFIDKHAAHERMNYERMKAEAENGINTQLLLSPAVVRLSSEEYSAVIENISLLEKCGIVAEDFGTSSVIVRELPAIIADADPEELIVEIAGKLLEHKTDIEPDKMDWVFHSASCRAAVKGGDYTSPEEQEMFVKKLLSMPNIRYCPHGRPVMIKYSKYQLEKQLGRIQ